MAETVSLLKTSRFKDTAIFRAEVDKVITALIEVPPEFYQTDPNSKRHTLAQHEIGFLDRLAVAYYGEGFESLWVAVAFANGVTDPEFDLQPGDVLVIPPRPLVMQFLARAGRGGT